MVYGTAADVQDLIAQFVISTQSTPMLVQLGTILTDISNEIDVTLDGAGIAAPVATPQYFVDWLGRLNAYGTAAAVLKSMFPAAADPGEQPAYAFWEERYQKGLQGIRDRTMTPSTVVTNANTIQPSTYLTRNSESEENLGDIAEPLFLVGKKF